MQTKPWTGVLSTGGRLLFGGTGGGLASDDAVEAYFYALDAENGKELWRINLGGTMTSNPITYIATVRLAAFPPPRRRGGAGHDCCANRARGQARSFGAALRRRNAGAPNGIPPRGRLDRSPTQQKTA